MLSEVAPGFLVAAPALLDPNFRRTVVLLVDHQKEGSLGFVVNREADINFESVVHELGIDATLPVPNIPVMVGGPVAPHSGWIVYDPALSNESSDGVIAVSKTVEVSASREKLVSLAQSDFEDRHLLVLGYAGWGAGQLDEEIMQGAWIPVDLDAKVIFDTPVEGRWDAALAALGIDPRQLVAGATLS